MAHRRACILLAHFNASLLSARAASGQCAASVIAEHGGFLTAEARRRQPSAIRELAPLLRAPGLLSLGGGMPNPTLFPFVALSFATSDGLALSLTPQELNEALQYSPTSGLEVLTAQLEAMQMREHNLSPASTNSWGVIVTNGSQDALTRAIQAVCAPGDTLLCESPTYSGTLSFTSPLGLQLVAMPLDAKGAISPDALNSMLVSWPTSGPRPKPRVLYVVPTGSNPSGATLSREQREGLYRVCCVHNILILEGSCFSSFSFPHPLCTGQHSSHSHTLISTILCTVRRLSRNTDDPYYYLLFGHATAPARDADFVRPRLPSLLSMDIEQRVLRFDSMSKILSSGLRIGWVSGANTLLRAIELHMQSTVLHTSGVSQALVAKLLSAWGSEGWERHLRKVALFYARKRDLCVAAARRHLEGLARFSTPDAGMFLWIELLAGVRDSRLLITQKAVDAKVLFVPGAAFDPTTPSRGAWSRHVRAAYSTLRDSEFDTAFARLANLLRAEQKK